MAFFDRMKDSLTTAGQEVSQKAKNATENVRLGNLIKNNDKMVDKLLYQVLTVPVQPESDSVVLRN